MIDRAEQRRIDAVASADLAGVVDDHRRPLLGARIDAGRGALGVRLEQVHGQAIGGSEDLAEIGVGDEDRRLTSVRRRSALERRS